MEWGIICLMYLVNIILMAFLMTGAWLIYRKYGNAAIVDIAWALGFFITALTSCLAFNGYVLRKLLLFSLVSIWALRLAGYLYVRYKKGEEDGRYRSMREGFGAESNKKFYILFLLQGFLIVILSWPFVLIASNQSLHVCVFEIIGVILWLLAYTGEVVADWQLFSFKMNPENQKLVFKSYLWKYSRHPNYFFEFLIWIAYSLMAIGAPWGITGIISPFIMCYILTQVSGIKLTEEHLVRTKGKDYIDYQTKTSSFFPWFPSKKK